MFGHGTEKVCGKKLTLKRKEQDAVVRSSWPLASHRLDLLTCDNWVVVLLLKCMHADAGQMSDCARDFRGVT